MTQLFRLLSKPDPSRRRFWCRLGLHRWMLGVDAAADPFDRVVVAMCSDCGRMEMVDARAEARDA